MQDLETLILLLPQRRPAVDQVAVQPEPLEPVHEDVEHLLRRVDVFAVEVPLVCEVHS